MPSAGGSLTVAYATEPHTWRLTPARPASAGCWEAPFPGPDAEASRPAGLVVPSSGQVSECEERATPTFVFTFLLGGGNRVLDLRIPRGADGQNVGS